MVLLTLDAGDGEPLVLPLIVTVATSVETRWRTPTVTL